MIRWYDWIFAFIAADLMLTTLLILLTSTNMFLTFFSALSVFFLFDVWDKYYCKFRVKLKDSNNFDK